MKLEIVKIQLTALLFLLIPLSCKSQFQLSVGGGLAYSDSSMPHIIVEPNYQVKDFIFGFAGGYLISDNHNFTGQLYVDLFPPSRFPFLDKKCFFGMGIGSFYRKPENDGDKEFLIGFSPRIGYKVLKKARVMLSVIAADSDVGEVTLTSFQFLYDF